MGDAEGCESEVLRQWMLRLVINAGTTSGCGVQLSYILVTIVQHFSRKRRPKWKGRSGIVAGECVTLCG